MHRSALGAPCVGLQYGLPLGLFARWTTCRRNLFLSRADVKTLVLALEHCKDSSESLALQDSSGAGLNSLYGLYSSILKGPRTLRLGE